MIRYSNISQKMDPDRDMSFFDVRETPLEGLLEVQRLPRTDDRGFFSRLFCQDEAAQWGVSFAVRQINHTLTRGMGTSRGFHYQLQPHAEDKFVSCLQGSVFDVAIDLRKDSPTFLKSHSVVLSNENMTTLLIPKGFAHGFQCLSEECVLLYLHSEAYNPASERGLNMRDPKLVVDWPYPLTGMSDRDLAHLHLTDDFRGIEL